MAFLTRRWRVLCCAALLALQFVSGCATAPSPASEQARLRKVRAELIARGDADSLATAAFFERFAIGHWAEASALAARAAAAAPHRADLAYVQLLLCYQQASCAPRPLEARLRELDPANGITWIFALGRAMSAQDAAGVNAALTGLAGAQRVDLYWTALVSRMTAALTRSAGFDRSAAFVAVVGVDAAMTMPPLQPVSLSCSRAALADAQVLDRCRRMTTALEHADTVLFESYGNHLAARLWPEGSAESTAIAAERGVLDYRMGLWSARQLNSPQAIRDLAELYGKYPTEQATLRVWYTQQGVRTEPGAEAQLN